MFVKGDPPEPEKAVFRRTTAAGIEEKIINGWAGLADCAHYLSNCLTAGGAAVKERGVAGLVETLRGRSDTKTLCEKAPRDRAQRVIDSGIFKKGDMIGYFNVDPNGDFGRLNSYTHSTMYVGKLDAAGIGGVTCHTVARFPPKSWVEDSWWLHPGYKYTLIHFSADDPAPAANKVAELAGWWKLDYGGVTEYYYILKDGRARYSKKAPASAKDNLMAGEGSAYWFIDVRGAVTFCWRATGTVEVWSPVPGGVNFKSMINGVVPGTLAKLF